MAVMVSELDRLRGAFVCLLLALARKYQVKVLGLTRDSLAAVLEKAYRRVILKCHPDKGGSGVDQVRLNDARDLWKAAARAPRARERPPPAAGTMALPGDARRRQETHRDARKRFDERTTPPEPRRGAPKVPYKHQAGTPQGFPEARYLSAGRTPAKWVPPFPPETPPRHDWGLLAKKFV